MTPQMIDFIHCAAWYAEIGGPVLEIGSYIEAGQDHLDLRRAFPRGTPYVGVDVLSGPGVDRQCDMLDQGQVEALYADVKPRVVLCLYVLEHVWDIREAAKMLGAMWQKYQDSWLFISTHQSQPFHGTQNYPDYWRITASGMKRLMEHAGVSGSHVFVSPDSSNPGDVMAIRQPGPMPWPQATFEKVLKAASLHTHWEQYS